MLTQTGLISYQKSSYTDKYSLNNIASKTTSLNSNESIREKLRNIQKEEKESKKTVAQALIENTKAYNETLRQKRLEEKNRNANLVKKKYQYKNVSSKIVQGKTSLMVRKALSSAKTEIRNLQKAKASGKYDKNELEAALAHAKVMERIARKKIRHLEEEEMAKATGKGKYEEYLEKFEKNPENATDDINENAIDEQDNEYEELLCPAFNGEYSDFENSIDYEEYEFDFEKISSTLEELTNSMLEDLIDSTDELLSGMGIDDLSEDLSAATGKMTEDDIKKMEINHRNKEMKEIVKANAEYLKAIF